LPSGPAGKGLGESSVSLSIRSSVSGSIVFILLWNSRQAIPSPMSQRLAEPFCGPSMSAYSPACATRD
jgi:hypothetical protein